MDSWTPQLRSSWQKTTRSKDSTKTRKNYKYPCNESNIECGKSEQNFGEEEPRSIVGPMLRERGAYVTNLTKQGRFHMTNSY